MIGYSTLCFMSGYMSLVWHILSNGTLHHHWCMGVCNPTVSMRGGSSLVVLIAVRDQVPITNRLFFCSSPSCVCVLVCWLRGVPCNTLLRVVAQRKQRFVSTFESPPAVDLSY